MFSIRVYGILINEANQVLVSDEFIRGDYFTKFPGGGLEFGEGTRDCLQREFLEEMNLKVEVAAHLYTTDFFQMSAFNAAHQIVSIYYYVKALEDIKVPLRATAFDFDEQQMKVYAEMKQVETFRFIDMKDFSSASVSLPIDKVVSDMVKEANAAS
jgi:8-oxo-dGTP diphosphatase